MFVKVSKPLVLGHFRVAFIRDVVSYVSLTDISLTGLQLEMLR